MGLLEAVEVMIVLVSMEDFGEEVEVEVLKNSVAVYSGLVPGPDVVLT